jgi:hypothetical protein
MSRKPYKALGMDLLTAARRDRERAVDTFIACVTRSRRRSSTTRISDTTH